MNAGDARPVRDGQGLALPSHRPVVALIAGLLRLCGPANVARLVIAVYVDAVKGMPWRRTLSNVSEERQEVQLPSVADSDASAAVVWIVLLPRIKASVLHLPPTLVGWISETVASCASVLCCPASKLFISHASARLRNLKGVMASALCLAAVVASAHIPLLALVGNDGQAIEPHPGKVSKSWHMRNFTTEAAVNGYLIKRQ
jgi:hypothetical protein